MAEEGGPTATLRGPVQQSFLRIGQEVKQSPELSQKHQMATCLRSQPGSSGETIRIITRA
jgi:hypothetical protein